MASRSCWAFPNIGQTAFSSQSRCYDDEKDEEDHDDHEDDNNYYIVYDDASKPLVKWPLGRWRPDASRSRQTTVNSAPMIRNCFNAIKIFRLHFLSVSCQTLHCFLSHYLLSFSQGCSRCLLALYIIWHCDLWGARGEDKRYQTSYLSFFLHTNLEQNGINFDKTP